MQKEVVVLVCDRCRGEQPATAVRRFCIGDEHWRLDLCVRHAASFDRQAETWAAAATKMPPRVHPRRRYHPSSVHFTPEFVDDSRQVSELRAREDVRQAAITQANERAAQDEQQARRSIPGARRWVISDHARDQMAARGFTAEEVLRAAAQPQSTEPHRDSERAAIHRHGDCVIVVDVPDRRIITVMERHGLEAVQ